MVFVVPEVLVMATTAFCDNRFLGFRKSVGLQI
jgi:hypothetical protein